ncbi:hypothetical protein ID866_2494 [Astraeus odoratus]|nr:hypothetical protein ID866_2494 [Astraeus odoratus]
MSNQAPPAVSPCVPDHEIIVLPPGHPDRQPLLDQCLGVRIDVFVHEQGFSLDVEVDEYACPVLSHSSTPYPLECHNLFLFSFSFSIKRSLLIGVFYLLVVRHDPVATHFLLRLLPSKTPIGTIRATRVSSEESDRDDSYYKLSRLAVLKPYRRYRFGRDLVLALHQWVKEDAKHLSNLEVAKVVAHSQIPVKLFYSKYGYLAEVIFPDKCYHLLIDTNGTSYKTGG